MTDETDGDINAHPKDQVVQDKSIMQSEPDSLENCIIFVDPTGVRWRFPFELCKDWQVSSDGHILLYMLTISRR
jgi:hypothetical protein